MIFVTVGTADEGFDRLVRWIDSVAPELNESIRAQIGGGEYVPKNMEWFRFTSEDEIQELYRTASVVIAHAGAGTLLTALSYEKPVIVLPRREQRGEHNDDHQMEIADALRDRPDVFVIEQSDELKPAIDNARSGSEDSIEPANVDSTTDSNPLVEFLSDYLEDIES